MSEEQHKDPTRLDLPSASAMQIIQACPGMQNLKNSLPIAELNDVGDAEEKEWAARGTRIHKAFETGITLELNNEECTTYETGVKYLESIKEKWIHDLGLDPSKVVEGPRELRVFLSKPYDFPKPMGSAMTDRHFIYRSGDRCCLLCVDLKSGWNPNLPPTAHSWQLKYELVTLWTEYDGVTEGRVAYVKAKDKCERGDYCDYQDMDLKYAFDSIAFHSWESSQPDAPRHPGEHCRWCACRAHCPEALAFALLPSTMVRTSKVGRKREIATEEVIPEDLYKLWQFKGAITAILEAVIDRLKTFTDEDLAKIGLMRGKARQGAFFRDLKGACLFLTEEKALFAPEQVWQHMDLALGPLASIYALRTGNTEEASKEYLKGILAPYMGVKDGERSIVRLK